MRRYLISLLVSFLLVTPSLASDMHSPRTAGLGGAGHAGPMLNDTIFLNPSFTSFLPAYSFYLGYLLFNGMDRTTAAGPTGTYGRNYTLSLLDGRSELFQAGVAYTLRENGSMVHIGASRLAIKQLGFGLGGKLYFPNTGSSTNDLSFSTTFIPEGWLHLSFIADNLIQGDRAKELNWFREFILASKFNVLGIIMAYLDPHYTPELSGDQEWGYEFGLELTVFNDFFIRTGMFRNSSVPHLDGLRGRGFGFGVGWIGPRMSVDYGLSRVLEANNNYPATTAHVFSATVFF